MKKLIHFLIRLYSSLPRRLTVAHRLFLVWRYKHMTNQQFILLLSILVGFSSGIVAVILKNTVHFIQSLLDAKHQNNYENYLFLIYPAIGIAITIFIIRYCSLGLYHKHTLSK